MKSELERWGRAELDRILSLEAEVRTLRAKLDEGANNRRLREALGLAIHRLRDYGANPKFIDELVDSALEAKP